MKTETLEAESMLTTPRFTLLKIGMAGILFFSIFVDSDMLFGTQATVYEQDCGNGSSMTRISVRDETAPWGSYTATFTPSDDLRARLTSGSFTINGTFEDGTFHGSNGLVFDGFSGTHFDCSLPGNGIATTPAN